MSFKDKKKQASRSSCYDDAFLASISAALMFVLIFGSLSWLFINGTWKGCVLSAAWCSGPGSLSSPHEFKRRAAALVIGGTSVSISMILTLSRSSPLFSCSEIYALVSLASIMICLAIPMSCGALEGGKWRYLGFNDMIHDSSLISCFVFFSLSIFTSPLHIRNLTAKIFFYPFLACAFLGIIFVNWCPVLSTKARIVVLLLEVCALIFAHLTHLHAISHRS